MSEAVKKWIIGIAASLVVASLAWGAKGLGGALVAQVDRHYLVHAEFDQYVQMQTIQQEKSEVRELEDKAVTIAGELKYGNPTPERRAQLETLLDLYTRQVQELRETIKQQLNLANEPE